MCQTHRVPPVAAGEDPFIKGVMASVLLLVSVKGAWSCETASAARLLARIVRRAILRAPSRFGGSSASMRRQVLALMTTPQRDSLSSLAIDSVNRPSVGSL